MFDDAECNISVFACWGDGTVFACLGDGTVFACLGVTGSPSLNDIC